MDLLVGGTGKRQALRRPRRGAPAPGRDTLYGGLDNVLSDGARGDTMIGGSGVDTFHYHGHVAAFKQSAPGERDRVLDFGLGDRFDFREIDANAAIGGNQASILAAGPSGQAGRMWIEGTGQDRTVFLNVDGGAADLAVDVRLAAGTTGLGISDFLLWAATAALVQRSSGLPGSGPAGRSSRRPPRPRRSLDSRAVPVSNS